MHELAVLLAAFAAHGGLENLWLLVVVGGFFLAVGEDAVVVVVVSGRISFSGFFLVLECLVRLRSSIRSCSSAGVGVYVKTNRIDFKKGRQA